MAKSIADKFRIKEGMKLLTIDAPEEFEEHLAPPRGVQIAAKLKAYDQIHWFVMSRKEMEAKLNKVLALIKEDVLCWIYYPKGTSKIQTDLTRDKGWDKLMKHDELQWISLISFDETWSAFAARLKTAADMKKEAAPKERLIFQYADPKAKTVRVPEDLAKAFKLNKKAKTLFETLSYSCRKEYVEWIITAKKEETRIGRVQGTLERLEKGWKNPQNQ